MTACKTAAVAALDRVSAAYLLEGKQIPARLDNLKIRLGDDGAVRAELERNIVVSAGAMEQDILFLDARAKLLDLPIPSAPAVASLADDILRHDLWFVHKLADAVDGAKAAYCELQLLERAAVEPIMELCAFDLRQHVQAVQLLQALDGRGNGAK